MSARPAGPSADDAYIARMREEMLAAVQQPVQFLEAWKDGVQLAGPSFFGHQAGYDPNTKWGFCPLQKPIEGSFGVLSSGEKVFLAAMVSFYNSDWGQKLLKRAGAPNICDISAGMDSRRRAVIARLFQNYNGW